MNTTTPPFLQPGDRVVLFDGVCKLCNGSVRFLIRHDRNKKIKLASVQSVEGQALLAWFCLPTERFDTMALIEDNTLYVRSEAFLRVMKHLPQPWRLLTMMSVIPQGIRDWCYDRIAQNRSRLFGRYDTCQLPSPDHKGRFLDDQD
jgi:predicted DCC family thiol-disulfide oxidoreductase YuxK